MKVFLKSIKESSIKAVLSPQLRTLSWSFWVVFPTCFPEMYAFPVAFFKYLLTWVNRLPFVILFRLCASSPCLLHKEYYWDNLHFVSLFCFLVHGITSLPRCLLHEKGTPIRTLHHILFWNIWCGFCKSQVSGNHCSRTSSPPLCLREDMRFSCLLKGPHLT